MRYRMIDFKKGEETKNEKVIIWNVDGVIWWCYPCPFAARPGFQRPAGTTASRSHLEPIPITEKGLLPKDYVMEDPDSHFIYVCKKIGESDKSVDTLADDEMQR